MSGTVELCKEKTTDTRLRRDTGKLEVNRELGSTADMESASDGSIPSCEACVLLGYGMLGVDVKTSAGGHSNARLKTHG